MKSVLISISPYWYYLIGEHIKTIEVRKTIPKANDWNGIVECYMTNDKKSFSRIPKEFQAKYASHMGKVGMKFVCNRIDDFYCCSVPYRERNNLGYGAFIDNGVYKVRGWHEGVVFERNDRYIDSMLKNNDLKKMCLSVQEIFDYIGIGKHLYGWHISDLKIYDKPRELGEFAYWLGFVSDYATDNHGHLKRPPQSWCYVEEV